jgi:hypothetical protein
MVHFIFCLVLQIREPDFTVSELTVRLPFSLTVHVRSLPPCHSYTPSFRVKEERKKWEGEREESCRRAADL